MLKYIKPKDLVEFLLLVVGVNALILIAGILESAPLGWAFWIAVILALVLTLVWLIVTARQRTREAKARILWVSNGKEWVAQDGSGRTQPIRQQGVPELFDQNNYENKEQA